MPIDYAARRHLYDHARRTWDEEAARTLMDGLGWDADELARRDEVDLRFVGVDARFERVDARFDKVDARFDRVEARFDKLEAQLLKRVVMSFVVVNATFAGLIGLGVTLAS